VALNTAVTIEDIAAIKELFGNSVVVCALYSQASALMNKAVYYGIGALIGTQEKIPQIANLKVDFETKNKML